MTNRSWIRRASAAAASTVLAIALAGLAPGGTTHAAGNAPGGSFDRLTGDGQSWYVYGWAVDADTPTSAVSVSITVDGVAVKTVVAGDARADVATRFPGAGSAHGFATTIPLPAAGSHYVCAYATDTDGSGTSWGIGCKKGVSKGVVPPTTPAPTPGVGGPTAVDNRPGGAFSRLTGNLTDRTWTATGFMADIDTPNSPVQVDVYIDGVFVKAGVADATLHLFSITMPMPAAGFHYVCIYGLNTDGSDNNQLIGCKTGFTS